MNRISLTLFPGHILSHLPSPPHLDEVLLVVTDEGCSAQPENYYFRLGTPVREDLLDEVEQLLSDLLRHQVVKCGGLQPQLF